ncbi:MAG: AAA family ATPase [Planctomycetota bacterium]|jgi:predicted ABC-type ATPase
MKRSPHVVVIAGPNGAGKSSMAPSILRGSLGVGEFVNTDAIALGLSAFRPERAALAAGKIMLRRLRGLAEARADFAFESMLAGRTYAPWLASLRRSGYHVHILFLWLSSPELAVARVAARVRLGGHDVPAEDIRRRYRSGLRNLFALYRPLATDWQVLDNSLVAGPCPVAVGRGSKTTKVHDEARWERIRKDGRDG